MNGELKVRITGDAAGFNQTLSQSKDAAAKFNTQLQQQTVASNNRAAAIGNAANKGFAVTNAAGALSGIPGVGDTAGKVAQAGMAFIGLKESANVLKVGMAKMAGIVAVAAFAVNRLHKLYTEAYGVQKHLQTQLEGEVRESVTRVQTEKAYRKVLEDNRKSLSKEDYERLRRGVTLNDPKAKEEVRRRFGGTELNKQLTKDLQKQRLQEMLADAEDAMSDAQSLKDGPRKKAAVQHAARLQANAQIAAERMKYNEEREALGKRIGPNPSQATAQIARQIAQSMANEFSNKVAEIQKKQLEELKKINSNTKNGLQFK